MVGRFALGRSAALFLLATMVAAPLAATEEEIDLDQWHANRQTSTGEEPPLAPRLALGLYPALGGVFGIPNVAALAADGYLSLTSRGRFSVFAGYGIERGYFADAEVYTLGWGGVRRLPSARTLRGFYGNFIRYRRWDHRDHGIHHGLSVGTESGAGRFGLGFELGAARSERNHWMITARVTIKVGIPILIPLRS